MREMLPNKRFVSLEWKDIRSSWQNILAELDSKLEGFSSLSLNSPHIYFLFGISPTSLFLARSVTGHLADYLLENLKLVDLTGGPADFDEREGKAIFSEGFTALKEKREKGFVEIIQRKENNLCRYVRRESKDSLALTVL